MRAGSSSSSTSDSKATRLTASCFVSPVPLAHVEAQAGHDDEDDEEDTTASRFNTELFNFVSQGFDAKDKHVRYRCCQLAALLLPRMPALE